MPIAKVLDYQGESDVWTDKFQDFSKFAGIFCYFKSDFYVFKLKSATLTSFIWEFLVLSIPKVKNSLFGIF